MPKASEFTSAEKATIKGLREEGMSCKKIASRLGRSEAGVRAIYRTMKDVPLSSSPPRPKQRSGRPRLTTSRQDEQLRRYVNKNPFKTAKELKREVPGFQQMSVRRIQDVLRSRLDLPSRCAAKKPLLTDRMALARMRFAKKHRHLTADQWEKTMFSDESTFRLINPRSQTVRRSTGT